MGESNNPTFRAYFIQYKKLSDIGGSTHVASLRTHSSLFKVADPEMVSWAFRTCSWAWSPDIFRVIDFSDSVTLLGALHSSEQWITWFASERVLYTDLGHQYCEGRR